MDISLVFTKEEREDLADGLDELLYSLSKQLDIADYNQNMYEISKISAKLRRVGKLHDKVTERLYSDAMRDELISWGINIYNDAMAEENES